MAIIVCKKCGKKFSDTLSVCIHCGQDQSLEVAPEEIMEPDVSQELPTVEEIAEPEQTETKASDTVKASKYENLSLKRQMELEEEFISSHPKEAKMGRFFDFLSSVSAVCMGFVLASVFGAAIPTVAALRLFPIINYTLFMMPYIVCISVAAVSVLVGAGTFVLNLILQLSKTSERYNQAFNKWLKEEKNIINDD